MKKKWNRPGLKRVLLKQVYNFYPKYYHKTIWLIGTGRSGTTWISSLINHDNTYRELFEPFHPELRELKSLGLKKHHYLKPGTQNVKIEHISKQIFNGSFYSPRVEYSNKLIWSVNYKNILVKDIFASLLAFEICNNNQQIKPILLLRNPFAVALSKKQTKHWNWMDSPSNFLKQKDLVDDFLKPYVELIQDISANGSYIDKQILIWCIINFIPLVQFKEKDLLVSFYEDWIMDPDNELKRINEYIGLNQIAPYQITKTTTFQNPSRTAQKKSFNVSKWRRELTLEQIKSGERILERFGLKKIYTKDSVPDHIVLNEIRMAK